MPLVVNAQPDTLLASTFSFIVPGHQQWALRSIRADVARGAGGTPDRSYELQITNGTSIVAAVPADDAGDEPGVCSITWVNANPSKTAAATDGVVVAPLAPVVLDPGYVVVCSILNDVADDAWLRAVAWYEYVDLPG